MKFEGMIAEAYEILIPDDRIIVDALVFTLANKDKEIAALCKELSKELERRVALAAVAQT
jgi:hypothetical protein